MLEGYLSLLKGKLDKNILLQGFKSS